MTPFFKKISLNSVNLCYTNSPDFEEREIHAYHELLYCISGNITLLTDEFSQKISAGTLVPEATFMKQTATCVPPKADTMVIGMGLSVTQTTEMLVSRLLSGSNGNSDCDVRREVMPITVP